MACIHMFWWKKRGFKLLGKEELNLCLSFQSSTEERRGRGIEFMFKKGNKMRSDGKGYAIIFFFKIART